MENLDSDAKVGAIGVMVDSACFAHHRSLAPKMEQCLYPMSI